MFGVASFIDGATSAGCGGAFILRPFASAGSEQRSRDKLKELMTARQRIAKVYTYRAGLA